MLWSLKRSLNFKEMYEDQSGEFVYRNWASPLIHTQA